MASSGEGATMRASSLTGVPEEACARISDADSIQSDDSVANEASAELISQTLCCLALLGNFKRRPSLAPSSLRHLLLVLHGLRVTRG
ncbi:unnamed protein product [Lampetra planeri]